MEVFINKIFLKNNEQPQISAEHLKSSWSFDNTLQPNVGTTIASCLYNSTIIQPTYVSDSYNTGISVERNNWLNLGEFQFDQNKEYTVEIYYRPTYGQNRQYDRIMYFGKDQTPYSGPDYNFVMVTKNGERTQVDAAYNETRPDNPIQDGRPQYIGFAFKSDQNGNLSGHIAVGDLSTDLSYWWHYDSFSVQDTLLTSDMLALNFSTDSYYAGCYATYYGIRVWDKLLTENEMKTNAANGPDRYQNNNQAIFINPRYKIILDNGEEPPAPTGYDQKYWRITFKKKYGNDGTGSSGDRSAQISEIKLFDANGDSLTDGLESYNGGNGTPIPADVTTLQPGQCASNLGIGNYQDVSKAFDNNLDSKWCQQWLSLPDFTVTCVLRLANDSNPVCSYNFWAAEDMTPNRVYISWDIECSYDGATWMLVDSKTDYLTGVPTQVKQPYNNGIPFILT